MASLQGKNQESSTISRREFIQVSTMFIGMAAMGASGCLAEKNSITMGMFADVHYADRAMKINRYYQELLVYED